MSDNTELTRALQQWLLQQLRECRFGVATMASHVLWVVRDGIRLGTVHLYVEAGALLVNIDLSPSGRQLLRRPKQYEWQLELELSDPACQQRLLRECLAAFTEVQP